MKKIGNMEYLEISDLVNPENISINIVVGIHPNNPNLYVGGELNKNCKLSEGKSRMEVIKKVIENLHETLNFSI